MDDEYRLTVTLDREVNRRLDAKLPWGSKTQLLRKVVELIADFVDKHGIVAVALVLEDRIELRAKGSESGHKRERKRTKRLPDLDEGEE